MKKIFTLIALAMLTFSGASAQDVISWEDAMTKTNSISNEAGYKLQITGNSSKAWSAGNQTFTIDGTDYKTIKVSNGAQNTLTAPEGKTFNKVTLYSYINQSVEKAKTTVDGTPYLRDSYWKEVNGVNYSLDGAVDKNGNPTVTTTKMKAVGMSEDDLATLQDASNYVVADATTFDKYEFTLAKPVSTLTFTNTGEQVGFVMVLETVTTGINGVKADNATIDVNAPAYNLAGQRVNNDYKGVIIKDGKKFLNNK